MQQGSGLNFLPCLRVKPASSSFAQLRCGCLTSLSTSPADAPQAAAAPDVGWSQGGAQPVEMPVHLQQQLVELQELWSKLDGHLQGFASLPGLVASLSGEEIHPHAIDGAVLRQCGQLPGAPSTDGAKSCCSSAYAPLAASICAAACAQEGHAYAAATCAAATATAATVAALCCAHAARPASGQVWTLRQCWRRGFSTLGQCAASCSTLLAQARARAWARALPRLLQVQQAVEAPGGHTGAVLAAAAVAVAGAAMVVAVLLAAPGA